MTTFLIYAALFGFWGGLIALAIKFIPGDMDPAPKSPPKDKPEAGEN